MKSNAKSKIIILITLGLVISSSLFINTNNNPIEKNNPTSSEYSDDSNLDDENLKISTLSAPIYIDDTNPSSNWSVAEIAGICSGNGTYSDPYIIEDLIIDGGGSGNCIWIENSNVFFKIENCTLYNSIGLDDAGILLSNVNNGQLINNTCSFNYNGIYLENCDNNSISQNIVKNETHHGIKLESCDFNIVSWNIVRNNTLHGIIIYGENNTILKNNVYNNDQCGLLLTLCNNNTISGNTANKNQFYGINLYRSDNNTISGNIANSNRYGIGLDWAYHNVISGNILNNNSHYGIEISDSDKNTVSENNMSYNNLIGIFLSYSDDNTISGNFLMHNEHGIWSYTGSNYNKIIGNTANYNEYGISLCQSNFNIVSGNNLLGNEVCINEINCQGNEFSNNGSCTYGQRDEVIPGYNLGLLLGILSVLIVILSKRLKKY